MRLVRIAVGAVMCCAIALIGQDAGLACTAFCAAGGGNVLVGNNEDWNNPHTKIWFVPARPDSYGRVYVGFDDLWPQGGMNERGLWFDGFAAPPVKAGSPQLPHFQGNLVDKAMAECATVEEVVRLFSRYNRGFLAEGILMFADASGDAASIERNAIVRKSRAHFVQTNFHQSIPQSGRRDDRFKTASAMLERAGDDISVDLFRRILEATYQKGPVPTLYSNIYDLRSRTLYLYYFHDFNRVVTFHLDDELKKGERVLDIPALFPRSPEAEAFAAAQPRKTRGRGPTAAIAMLAFFGILIAVVVFIWVKSDRRIRIALSGAIGLVALCVAAGALTLRLHRPASQAWAKFSIGPASGRSTSIQPTMLRADGVTLKVALALAYDMPPVRVIGPPWLAQTRYAINAAVDPDKPDMFRSLLREELEKRLHLDTHTEVRPFDVFVLTAARVPRLERARGTNVSTWLNDSDVQLRNASMGELAAALQSILGKPVVDETGITGSYDVEFGWSADRVASVTAVLHDRFGLHLSPGRRDMEVLVVDNIRRDPALVLLAHIGRITAAAPAQIREQIAAALTIH